MSSIMIAAILVGVTVGIPTIFISIFSHNKRKKKADLMKKFHEEGSKRGLSFSSTEHLKGTLVGFDGLKQSFLIYDFENENQFHQIDLATVSKCIVKKETEIINAGEPNKPIKENHLRSIELVFEHNGRTAPYSVCYYHSNHNSIYEIAELEMKAKYWETMVGKIVGKRERVRA